MVSFTEEGGGDAAEPFPAGSYPHVLATLCQESPKRLKDTEAEGDSALDGNKSNAEAKLNDVAGPDSEVQEKAREGGQQTADKVRRTDWARTDPLDESCNIVR